MITEILAATAAVGTVLCGLLNLDADYIDNLKNVVCSSGLKDFVEHCESTSVYSDNTDGSSFSSLSDYASSSPEEKSRAYSERSSIQQIESKNSKTEIDLDSSSHQGMERIGIVEHRSPQSEIRSSGDDKLEEKKLGDSSPDDQNEPRDPSFTEDVVIEAILQKLREHQRKEGTNVDVRKVGEISRKARRLRHPCSPKKTVEKMCQRNSKGNEDGKIENVEVDFQGIITEQMQKQPEPGQESKPERQESGLETPGAGTQVETSKVSNHEMSTSLGKSGESRKSHVPVDGKLAKSIERAEAVDLDEHENISVHSKKEANDGLLKTSSFKESISNRSNPSSNAKENVNIALDPEIVANVPKDAFVDISKKFVADQPSRQGSKYVRLLIKLSSSSPKEPNTNVFQNSKPTIIQTMKRHKDIPVETVSTTNRQNIPSDELSFSDLSTLSESLHSANSFDSETLIPPPVCDSRRIKRIRRPFQKDRVGLFRKMQKPWL